LDVGKDVNYFHHFVYGFCKWLLPSEWNVSRCKKNAFRKISGPKRNVPHMEQTKLH